MASTQTDALQNAAGETDSVQPGSRKTQPAQSHTQLYLNSLAMGTHQQERPDLLQMVQHLTESMHQLLAKVVLLEAAEDRYGPALLTREEAATYLSISLRTLDALLAEGTLQSIYVTNRTRRISRDALDRFIRQKTYRA